jgi:hypothetical protein
MPDTTHRDTTPLCSCLATTQQAARCSCPHTPPASPTHTDLSEHAVAVADAVAPCRQVEGGHGVQEAGCQATQASIAQCCIPLLLCNRLKVVPQLTQRLCEQSSATHRQQHTYIHQSGQTHRMQRDEVNSLSTACSCKTGMRQHTPLPDCSRRHATSTATPLLLSAVNLCACPCFLSPCCCCRCPCPCCYRPCSCRPCCWY